MGTINALECGKAVTILAQGLITGSAYYITMVEVPARMSLSMPSAIKSWRPCFDRAKNSQVDVDNPFLSRVTTGFSCLDM